jgi:hypothetical protein
MLRLPVAVDFVDAVDEVGGFRGCVWLFSAGWFDLP